MANLQRVAVPGTMFDTLTHDLQTTAQANFTAISGLINDNLNWIQNE